MKKTLADLEQRKRRWYASVASCRGSRWSTPFAYQKVQQRMLLQRIPAGASVLHVGCGRGDLLAALVPKRAVGVEPSAGLAAQARQRHPELEIIESSLEAFRVQGHFDYILVDDVLLDCFDVDDLLACIHQAARWDTRILITNVSKLWRPILKLLCFLHLAKTRFGDTWFSPEDLRSALARNDFEVISASPEVLFPVDIPVLTALVNCVLARLPVFRSFCLHHILIARIKGKPSPDQLSVSVVVPAKNESGNIPRLIKEIPKMGRWTEVIFVEGNSTDDTYAVLEAAVKERNDPHVRLIQQTGKGKGDAVRAGFAEAKGDILMILDADLTVPAETLPKFYNVLATGHADFANGTRLVYGMDDRAMQFLNLLANHFFAHAFTFVLGQPIRDTLCGTKVLRRDLYEKIVANRSYFGDFDPFGDFDLLFGAARLHAKITDVPVRYFERAYGTTNISRFRHGLLLFRMLAIAASRLKFQ